MEVPRALPVGLHAPQRVLGTPKVHAEQDRGLPLLLLEGRVEEFALSLSKG